MKFLIDEDLPRSTGNLLRRYGHEATDVRDIGLRGVKDSQIASYAKDKNLCLVTGDFDFSDIRNYPPSQYAGLLVLSIPRDATASFILNLLDGVEYVYACLYQVGYEFPYASAAVQGFHETAVSVS